MANQEHLDILKRGIKVWNNWRDKRPDIRPDLIQADISTANLPRIDLSGANLWRADLSGANLSEANLSETDLEEANLWRTNLRKANLWRADLGGVDLRGGNLRGANLSEAHLGAVNLWRADLGGAELSRAKVAFTIFGDIDLSMVKGLETVNHVGPSEISSSTLYRSRGNIPEKFLRDAGVPDSFITYLRSLVDKPFDFYSCFISYSSRDQKFAERLHADLQSKGVRCWFAPEDMIIGDKIRSRIDEAIRLYDKLLLVLSEYSVESTWVEKEVETAFEKERLQRELVLFPIQLDETVMQTTQAWAADIRRTRHIGDFRNWKNPEDYQKVFNRLLRDLKAGV